MTIKKPKSRKRNQTSRAILGPQPPYGDAIHDAIAKGEMAEMRQVAYETRMWINRNEQKLRSVRKALAQLERALKRLDHRD